MIIKFYQNLSEQNKILKTLVDQGQIDGVFKESTSIIDPILIIKDLGTGEITTSDGEIINDILINESGFDPLVSNYLYIPILNRYYYITGISSLRDRIWSISCHCDVLMSYQDRILDQYAFITRNEFEFDEMIRDDMISYKYDKNVVEYIPENGDKKNFSFNSSTSIYESNISISVIQDNMSMSFDSVQSPTNILPSVSAWNSGVTASYSTYAIYPASVSTLFNRLITINSNLSDGIMSVIAFPFNIPHHSNVYPLRIKGTDLTESGSYNQVNVSLMNHTISDYFVIADFTITGSTFFDYEPYSQYEIFLPYLGWIGLSADLILNKRLLVCYNVNYQNGNSQVSIIDDTSKKIIFTSSGQLGVMIPTNSTNQYDVERNKQSNNISLGLGLASSSITMASGIAMGIATYNPVAIVGGVVSGVMGGASSIASYINNNNNNYLKATGSVSSPQGGLYLPQEVRIRKTSYKKNNYDDDYFKLYGRPLNQYKKLRNVSGYTEIGRIHLENLGSATSSEIDEIETDLKSGVII